MPELAEGLKKILDKAHKDNAQFQTAFDGFFTLCQTALNPNIRREAVDEMLVQHLLTERLFRKIFHDDEFTKRNVIAAEVETVIAALVSKSFSRADFLKALDKFYKAIEAAAETIDDFADKQHFLNTVYERFFQGYSVKTADTHGIVYTPQPIVDFMCASVVEVLKTEFGLTLGSKEVKILDPCTGTGNFIVNLMRRVPKKDLPRVYREQLFANEVMLLPYYIAALNIEHAYGELTGSYEPFEGLCFADTLDLVFEEQLKFFSERNSERVERQKSSLINVVIGNPPYNANQVYETDNNKNRSYELIDEKIRTTYAKSSAATLKNKLYDPYVKFIRWATDRLAGKNGIVCYITNHSFFADPPFDGMRKELDKVFTKIYLIDLHGNVRQNQKLSGTAHNVFGIQTGVGISIFVKNGKSTKPSVYYRTVPADWRKSQKLDWLNHTESLSKVSFDKCVPDNEGNWLTIGGSTEFKQFTAMSSKTGKGIFLVGSTGAKSNRDDIVYGFDRTDLAERVQEQIGSYNSDLDRLQRQNIKLNLQDFLSKSVVKWSSSLKLKLIRGIAGHFVAENIRICTYRPYTKMFIYYDNLLNDRPGLFRRVLPVGNLKAVNLVICCTNHSQSPFLSFLVNSIANEAVGGRAGTCFPFYVYDPDGTNRQENITDWALKQFQTRYKDKKLTKWDIFYYVYGLLHHPGYRTKFADNLKRDLPRIPFAPDFRAFAVAGKALAELHLNYEDLEPFDLQYLETPGVPLSYVVEKMKLSKDKTSVRVNESLTLAGIPPEVFEYRLGNRSALDWVIDQYRVTEDKRSGIRSDPNRADDAEYIVKLVGRVIAVSVETVRIVKALPVAFAPA